jgi:hypothetical protein
MMAAISRETLASSLLWALPEWIWNPEMWYAVCDTFFVYPAVTDRSVDQRGRSALSYNKGHYLIVELLLFEMGASFNMPLFAIILYSHTCAVLE